MREEPMRDIHKELLQEIRERERGIWKFWTIMISALGSWILAFGKYLEKYNAGSSEYLWLFLGALIFALILLFWGVWIILTYGYHFRMFQKVLWNIEEDQCLTGDGETEGIIPSSWNPCKEGKWDLPMLYKVHLYTFNITIALVAAISLIAVPKEKLRWYVIVIVFLVFLVISAILCFLFRRHSQCKLKKMKKKFCLGGVQQCREDD